VGAASNPNFFSLRRAGGSVVGTGTLAGAYTEHGHSRGSAAAVCAGSDALCSMAALRDRCRAVQPSINGGYLLIITLLRAAAGAPGCNGDGARGPRQEESRICSAINTLRSKSCL